MTRGKKTEKKIPQVSGTATEEMVVSAQRKNTVSLIANRKYKDTVFRMVFSDRERPLELYNAVSGKHYDNPDDLKIVTLDNAVYMGMKNDLAFLLDMGIYLYEHQSTVNPNIPLRDLIYIASEYNTLVETKTLYLSTVQKIPTPNFIVFYNGQSEMADRGEYRLSDAFATKVDEPALELKVTVLNVNYGRNLELMEQCRTLKEYAQYVAMVRKYKAELGSLDDAVKVAVDECIKEGILSDFLRRNRAEVEMTSILEYNQEEEEKKIRAAELELGIERGRKIEKYQLINTLMTTAGFTLEEACKLTRVSLDDYREGERLVRENNN